MQFLFIDLQLKFKHHQDRVGQISYRIDFPVILAYGHLLDINIQLKFLDQVSLPIIYTDKIALETRHSMLFQASAGIKGIHIIFRCTSIYIMMRSSTIMRSVSMDIVGISILLL